MNCYNCNTEIPDGIHFCNYDCKDEYIANLPLLTGTLVTHCWQCGVEWKYKSQRRFHSSKCLSAFTERVKLELRVVDPGSCKHCHGEINYPVSGSFCSETCRKTHAERYRPIKKEPIIPNRPIPIPIKCEPEKPKPKPPKPTVYKKRICPVCSVEYEYESSNIENSFYCSNPCRNKSKRNGVDGTGSLHISQGSGKRSASYDVDDYY